MNSRYILTLLCSLLFVACDLFRPEEFDIITIRNAYRGINLFGPKLNFMDRGKKEFRLLARNEHIIQISQEPKIFFQLLAEDGTHLKIDNKSQEPFLYEINNKNAILFLNNTPTGWQWLANAPEREISSIRSLIFSDLSAQLKPAHLAFLQKLARNQHLGMVFFNYYSQNLIDILSILKPDWLYLEKAANSPAEETRLSFKLGITLTKQRQLKRLILADSQNKPEYLNQLLTFFPDLRSLWIDSALIKKVENSAFPQNLINLEELIINGELNTSAFIKKLRHLKRLTIHGQIMEKMDLFNELNYLQALNFYENAATFSSLNSLKDLRSFSVPPNMTQANFALLCQSKEQLRHVELINCDQITDYSPLLTLKQLKGVVLVNDSIADLTTFTKLKQLKYLVLSASISSSQINKIKASLPQCQILYGELASQSFNWGILVIIIVLLTMGGLLTKYLLNKRKLINK